MTFYNRFSIKAKKAQLTWYLIFCFLFLITLCVVYSFLKFSSSLEGEGIYHCNSTTCFLTTYFPLEIEKRLQTNQTILINNTEMKLDIAKIYDVTLVENVPLVKVDIKVPKQNWYLYQTVAFKIIDKKESIWTLLWKALKGGDDYSNER